MNDTSIDFLVLAPVEIEIKALQDILGWGENDQKVYQGYKYFTSVVPRDGCEPARVRVVHLPYQGVLMAAVPACRLIDAWRPDCVVSFGIMGGFLGDDIKLCDVLLADGALYYEPGKEAIKGSFLADPKPYCASPFTQFCAEGFDERSSESGFDPRPNLPPQLITKYSEWCGDKSPRVTRGWLASGEKLVADANSRSKKLILGLKRHVRGVEMEAAGVAEAVRTSVSTTPVLLIVKGVSDPAGEGKQRLDDFRLPAARNAAMCLKSVIANSTRLQRSREWIPASLTLKQASWVVNQLKPALYFPPDRDRSLVLEEWNLAIARALGSNKRPPVFYQWRIWNRGVHWIDFYFLLFLRQLKDRSDKSAIQLPIEVLVADKNDQLIGEHMQAGRIATTRIVKHILGSNDAVKFYTDTAELTEAQHYALDSGLTFTVRDQLRAVLHSMYGPQHDSVDETWIQYMAYTARAAQSCIVLNWYKRSSIAHFLNFFFIRNLASP